MAHALSTAAGSADRRAFFAKRLHSLTGIAPVGLFLMAHLWTNAAALAGPRAFAQGVDEIQRIPLLPLVEIFGIFLPLAYHAFYGVWLALAGRPNPGTYAYARNWLYVMQRVTGFVAFAFIVLHLWEFRVQKWLFGMSHDLFYTKLTEHLAWTWHGVPLIAFGYLLGVAASVFHLANGLATASITWGLTASRTAQTRAAVGFGALGVVLFVMGTATVLGLATGSLLLPERNGPNTAPCGSASSD